MQKLRYFLFGLTAIILASSFSDHGIHNRKRDRIEILFNANTGFTELTLIQALCGANGISLSYKTIEYDDNGRLQSIAFRVDCNDGFSGSASTKTLSNTRRFGFYRDYRENVKSPFGTGVIMKD